MRSFENWLIYNVGQQRYWIGICMTIVFIICIAPFIEAFMGCNVNSWSALIGAVILMISGAILCGITTGGTA